MSGFPYIKHPPPYTFLYYTSMSGGYTNLTSPITQPVGFLPPARTYLLTIKFSNIMEKNLIFKETLTVEQFKAAMHVSRIDVKQNPKTNKLFFTYGAKTGAVAVKGIPAHPMLSNVTTPDGQSFWLLHEEGQGGAPVLASF